MELWFSDPALTSLFFVPSYQTSPNGRRILQEWWNYYLPSKNLADFMEQVTYYSLAD